MTIANTVELVAAAKRDGYAVPAVNIVDDLSMRAIIAAAEAAQSPIILQTSVKTVKSMGAEIIAGIYRSAAGAASVPVALHLDHCPDRAVITEVIEHGWSSVLFDASDRPLQQAWDETREVVKECHAAGVGVESEIENIVGVEDGVGSDEATHSYSNDKIVEVADDTDTDLLAPALGTSHGMYKSSPVLQFDRVIELGKLTDKPVVLHGGTGLSPEDFQRFISNGVAKINISTTVKLAYMHAARDHIAKAEQTGKWEPVKMFDDVNKAVQATVTEHINEFGSAGKAATVTTGSAS